MITYSKRIAYILFITIVGFLASCNSSTIQESNIVEFLNKNEKTFDRKSFELVDLKLVDTINENEVYKVRDILDNKNGDIGYGNNITTVDSLEAYTAVFSWDYDDYPISLYNTLIDFNYYDSYSDFHRIKAFFDSTRIYSRSIFEKELINNTTFVDSLKSQMAYYGRPFTGCYDSDSLASYVETSRRKRKLTYGYLYLLKFRKKGVLNTRIFLLDSDNKILGYKNIDES